VQKPYLWLCAFINAVSSGCPGASKKFARSCTLHFDCYKRIGKMFILYASWTVGDDSMGEHCSAPEPDPGYFSGKEKAQIRDEEDTFLLERESRRR
jgi:hypothetical protein